MGVNDGTLLQASRPLLILAWGFRVIGSHLAWHLDVPPLRLLQHIKKGQCHVLQRINGSYREVTHHTQEHLSDFQVLCFPDITHSLFQMGEPTASSELYQRNIKQYYCIFVLECSLVFCKFKEIPVAFVTLAFNQS